MPNNQNLLDAAPAGLGGNLRPFGAFHAIRVQSESLRCAVARESCEGAPYSWPVLCGDLPSLESGTALHELDASLFDLFSGDSAAASTGLPYLHQFDDVLCQCTTEALGFHATSLTISNLVPGRGI